MLYQRFVKTTPKPRATKKSSGELVGPLPLLVFPDSVALGVGALDVPEADMMARGVSNVPYVWIGF